MSRPALSPTRPPLAASKSVSPSPDRLSPTTGGSSTAATRCPTGEQQGIPPGSPLSVLMPPLRLLSVGCCCSSDESSRGFCRVVLPRRPGNYWLHFAAEDDESVPNLITGRNIVRRKLASVQPPTFSDKGDDPYYWNSLADLSDPVQGYSTYVDPGIKATNPTASIDITDAVVMTHNVNTTRPGEYLVNYSVTYLDTGTGLYVTAFETRVVIVIGPWAPLYKGYMNGINQDVSFPSSSPSPVPFPTTSNSNPEPPNLNAPLLLYLNRRATTPAAAANGTAHATRRISSLTAPRSARNALCSCVNSWAGQDPLQLPFLMRL